MDRRAWQGAVHKVTKSWTDSARALWWRHRHFNIEKCPTYLLPVISQRPQTQHIHRYSLFPNLLKFMTSVFFMVCVSNIHSPQKPGILESSLITTSPSNFSLQSPTVNRSAILSWCYKHLCVAMTTVISQTLLFLSWMAKVACYMDSFSVSAWWHLVDERSFAS